MGRTSFQNNQLIKNDNLYFKLYIIVNGQKNTPYFFTELCRYVCLQGINISQQIVGRRN